MGSSRGPGSLPKFDPILQDTLDPVFWVNAERKLIGVNRAWESLTGFTASAVLGKVCRASAAIGDDSAEAWLASSFHVPDEALKGEPTNTVVLFENAEGSSVHKRIDFWVLTGAQNGAKTVIGRVRDFDTQPPTLAVAESDRLRVELALLRDRRRSMLGFEALVGRGSGHQRLLDQLTAASKSQITVLIVGEPGTETDLVAQLIHQGSSQAERPWMAIDCEALPVDLLERSLFRPTDETVRANSGSDRLAILDGSTLLLKNAIALPRDLQHRLLKAEAPTIRLVATTNDDPTIAFQDGRLVEEFHDRLTSFVIALKPLRNRLAELPLIAQNLLERADRRMGGRHDGFTSRALDVLVRYDWPGNVEELARTIEQAAKHCTQADRIDVGDLPAAIQGSLGSAYLPKAPEPDTPLPNLDSLLNQVEGRILENTLRRFAGNKSRAAEALGISRPRLHRRIKELNLDIGDAESSADD